ncbi:MAG: hypothetical protein J5I93_27315 [Pirellulaceae bacterium]|nr:hypothetical protein [Pirellulaceae bacterium]
MNRNRSVRLATRWLVALPLVAALLHGSVLRVTHHHHHLQQQPCSVPSATAGCDADSPAWTAVAGGHVHAGSCSAHSHLLGAESGAPAQREPAAPADAEHCAVCHYLTQVAEVWSGPSPQVAELFAVDPPAADITAPRTVSWSAYSTRAPPLPV